MNFFADSSKFLKDGKLNYEGLESVLKDSRDNVELLKYFMSVYKIPTHVLETDLGSKFKRFNSKVLLEIEKWLIIDDGICSFIEERKNGLGSPKKTLNAIWFVVKRFYSEQQFKQFNKEMEKFSNMVKNFHGNNSISRKQYSSLIESLPHSFLLKLANFFFSSKNVKEIFEPIISDWQEEYFEALFKKEIWKARWISIRYYYVFLVAMWQKSPIGDLIEFIRKMAK